ncbi:MAG: calcium/sodium antiporter [Eubacteriales bacterium]|nr:calcium/sodium antiporter [Eubacteriales bacterium]
MNYLLLIAGFILLIIGVDWFVDSAAQFAKKMRIPAFVIGLSIVAFGTSAPEAAIGIVSGLQKVNQITLGDVIGSSIVNITLIIGLTAIIRPLRVSPLIIKREIPLALIIGLVLTIMLWTGFQISRFEATILLIGFIVFVIFLGRESRHIARRLKPSADPEYQIQSMLKSERIFEKGLFDEIDYQRANVRQKHPVILLIGKLLLGLIALIAGSQLIVNSSVDIARQFGLSERFIGLTIIALGTSLPELTTCLVATFRKEDDIAVGNIVGSNIFNVLFVLGMSALIYPISSRSDALLDLGFMLFSTILLLGTAYFFKRISRRTGLFLTGTYLIFIAYKLSELG